MSSSRSLARITLLLITLLGASTALAFTVAELLARANDLVADYQDLATRVAACPDGNCAERTAIEADFTDAESARASLHGDRATLNPCGSCQALDGVITDADDLGDAVGVVIAGWEPQN